VFRIVKAEMHVATINDGELNLCIDDADEEGLRRGLIAARASLEASGFTFEEAFRGYFEREGADMTERLDELPDDQLAAAAALDDACLVAEQACAQGAEQVDASLSMQEVFAASQRRIDEEGLRDLNPDRGPHYIMERAQPE
jgi:hypothetical protein